MKTMTLKKLSNDVNGNPRYQVNLIHDGLNVGTEETQTILGLRRNATRSIVSTYLSINQYATSNGYTLNN